MCSRTWVIIFAWRDSGKRRHIVFVMRFSDCPVLHADGRMPLETQTSTDEDSGAKWVLPPDIQLVWRIEPVGPRDMKRVRRVEVDHPCHGGAVQYPQALYACRGMCIGRCSVPNCEIVQDEKIALLIFMLAAMGWVAQKVMVARKQLRQLLVLEKSQVAERLDSPDARPHFEHCACHAEMQPHTFAAADGVLVHKRMDNATVAVDRNAPAPDFLLVPRECVKGRTLVAETRTAAVISHNNGMKGGMAENRAEK